MMLCPDCGNHVRDEARICRHCGYLFHPVEARTPRREWMIVRVILIVLGVVILAALVATRSLPTI
jgi:predicted amidophosphoribosyltransferase